MPPWPSDSPSSTHMRAMSASVADSLLARSPMTAMRRVEWPTRKPALTASRPSRWSSHSPNKAHGQRTPACRAPSGMPSTIAIMRST